MTSKQEINPQDGSNSLIATYKNYSDYSNIEKYLIKVFNSSFTPTGCKHGSYFEYELKHDLPLYDENGRSRIQLLKGCFYIHEKYLKLKTSQERNQGILCTFNPPSILVSIENIDQFYTPIKNENNQNITMQDLGNYILRYKLLTDERASTEIEELLNKQGGIQENNFEILPIQDIKKIQCIFSQNTKEFQYLDRLEIGAEALINVRGKKDKTDIKNIVLLDYDDEKITLSKPITTFDKLINDTVVSMALVNSQSLNKLEMVFTPTQVWKAYTGSNHEPTKEQEQQIINSLDKQARCRIQIDATKECKMRGYKEGYFEGYLLPINKGVIQLHNDKKAVGYQLLETPPLFKQSTQKRQILRIETQSIRSATTGIRSTYENNLLVYELLRRIERCKENKLNKIKFDTLLYICNIVNPTKSKYQRFRKVVFKILENLVADENNSLVSFAPYYDNETTTQIKGVEIQVKSNTLM